MKDMKGMKRIAVLVMVTVMALGCATASAEVTANATVECDRVIDVTAPFSGVLLSYDWKAGSTVKAGDALFTLDTVKVYAPITGTAGAVFAEAGDDAEGVMKLYGALAVIEPDNPLRIIATTSGAHNDKENFFIHAGEHVYFKNTEDKIVNGEGRVISSDASGYIVEVTKGDYKQGTRVKLYRDEKYTSVSNIGTGSVSRANNILVQGAGRVVKSYVTKGKRVAEGMLLFELATGNPDPSVRSGVIRASAGGVIGSPQAISGQQVYKGQTLATIYDMQSLRVVAQVDEMDLDRLTEGCEVKVAFDRYENEMMTGTVEMIQKLGIPKQNATYYQVRISVNTERELLPGMSATVYLPQGGE